MSGIFVFTDFDETLIPKNGVVNRKSLYRLENFIRHRGYTYSWVSGANFEYLVRRSKDVVNEWPRFISSSLGSELHIHRGGGRYDPLQEWESKLKENGVSDLSLEKCTEMLLDTFSDIELQSLDYQGKYKRSYYSSGKLNSDAIAKFNLLADQQGYRVVVTKCSPMTGDPEGFYDVDLLPLLAGKGMSVRFIKRYCGAENAASFGFGDSENDLEMLSAVDHPFWVGNSKIEEDGFIRKTISSYTCGIYQAIAEAELED